MNENLNEQQFAQYSSIMNDQWLKPGNDGGPVRRLPASMERHAPGEYQPTLPGMEKMLEGEMTHTDVVFKHKNVAEGGWADIPGSRWGGLTSLYHPKEVNARAHALRPSQDWLDDNYLQDPIHPNTLRAQGPMPKVENIRGRNVIQDGHHRAAREILGGAKTVRVEQWGGRNA